jgi:hypothetical protein
VIEADSKEWHDDPITRQDDAAKQAILEAHGERVLRVTWAPDDRDTPPNRRTNPKSGRAT